MLRTCFHSYLTRRQLLLYRHPWLLAPVSLWTMASSGDAGQLGRGNRSGLNSGEGGPAQLPSWGLPAAPGSCSASEKVFLQDTCLPPHLVCCSRVVWQPSSISPLNLTPKSPSISLLDCGLKKPINNQHENQATRQLA